MAWEYSESTKRYRDTSTGQFLSPADATDLRDDFITRQREAMADLGRQLAADEVTVPQFERAFRERIRLATVTEFIYGRGGRNAMTEDDRGDIAGLVKEQWGFLNAFTVAVAAGELSAAQIEARAKLYAASTVQAHAAGEAAAWSGVESEERNLLGASDNCQECPELTALGWVASGTLPLPGRRECRSNCKCSIDRRAAANTQDGPRLAIVA